MATLKLQEETNMKKFIFGAWLGLTTWVTLAVISATIYNVTGNIDLLQAHSYIWSGSITLFSFLLDVLILKRLAN